ESADVQIILQRAQADNSWHIGRLDERDGYFCCAALTVDGKLGLIELYSADQRLGSPATGDLLSTLAVQISIALDNATLYDRLARRRAELETLLQRLINAQEEERRVVAYDIHDGLIQMLVSARLQLRNFTLDRGKADQRAEVALQKGLNQLAESIVEARRVIEGLRPAALDDLGLVATIRHFSAEMCAQSNCKLEFISNLNGLRLPMTVETTAFRIMQEAITNVRKYAHTDKLYVALHRGENNLQLVVQDWGQGFVQAAVAKGRGVGLFGMRERAKLLGGDCKIESTVGQGTRVTAWLPIKDKASYE
ncbi:MAG TPA: hypothetical protein ENJ56_02165, partial [Anaerolineae bacterium]|nr:hypothetical protein [Anaerolineae bacterium]